MNSDPVTHFGKFLVMDTRLHQNTMLIFCFFFPFTCLEIAGFQEALEFERFKHQLQDIQFLLPESPEATGGWCELKRSSLNEMLTYSVILVKSLHLTDHIHLQQLIRSSEPLLKIAITSQFHGLENDLKNLEWLSSGHRTRKCKTQASTQNSKLIASYCQSSGLRTAKCRNLWFHFRILRICTEVRRDLSRPHSVLLPSPLLQILWAALLVSFRHQRFN